MQQYFYSKLIYVILFCFALFPASFGVYFLVCNFIFSNFVCFISYFICVDFVQAIHY